MLLVSRIWYEADIVSICRCSSMLSRFVDMNRRHFSYLKNFSDSSRNIYNTSYMVNCSSIDKKCLLGTKRMFSNSLIKHVNGEKRSKTELEIEIEVTSKWLTIPNCLTLCRIGISPYIGYLVLCEKFTWALGLFILAGMTDSIDGWIARNVKGQCSAVGSFIDPLADKVLISCLILSLTAINLIPPPLCGMIVLRDVLIMTTSSHFHYKHLEPPRTLQKFLDFGNSPVKMEPTQISKYNTFLQLGLVTVSIAAPIFMFVDHPLLHAYWYLVATTTVISGLSYFVKDKSAYIRK